MLYSMTGYGMATSIFNHKNISIEVRVLNGKQLDMNIRLPQEYRSKEMDMRKIINKSLKRGKVDMFINTELIGEDGGYLINKPLVNNYIRIMKEISSEADLSVDQLDLMATAMRLPNATQPEKAQITEEEWSELKAILLSALEQCNGFRSKEGDSLLVDIQQRIEQIMAYRLEVMALAPKRLEEIKVRLLKSLDEFMDKKNINQDRFEQELIYYLEKLDITEETVRLESHCAHFLNELQTNTLVKGKKLNFISQEIGRELNTIGAKANYLEIQTLVVKMKDELEKIKEQMMNIL